MQHEKKGALLKPLPNLTITYASITWIRELECDLRLKYQTPPVKILFILYKRRANVKSFSDRLIPSGGNKLGMLGNNVMG